MEKIKLAILGTRGIPNQYGGFEQFAEKFAERFVAKGHEVTVYDSSSHPYQKQTYNGVAIIHCYDPEYKIGTAGQFIYDFNCILDSRKRDFDIILQLGYTSSTVWSWLFPKKKAIIATNMDGLEWKRSQYSKPVQFFLKYAEKWGALYSDYLIADSRAIQEYLSTTYNKSSVFIPYGADLFDTDEKSLELLHKMHLQPYQYDLLIARFEQENNIEMILKSYKAHNRRKLLLIGKYEANAFGKKLYEDYKDHEFIEFKGPVFDMNSLNVLRYYSCLYLHGHSVGGTNPSLLEAIAANALVVAHNNVFNKDVLGDEAYYFSSVEDLCSLLKKNIQKNKHNKWLSINREKITKYYNWEIITEQLETLFLKWLNNRNNH